jgi:hypothetical protein
MTEKKRTPTIVAATAANRIIVLRHECSVELANAPESIRARYREREEKVLEKLDPEVLRYVPGILAAHYDEAEEPDEAPESESQQRRGGGK